MQINRIIRELSHLYLYLRLLLVYPRTSRFNKLWQIFQTNSFIRYNLYHNNLSKTITAPSVKWSLHEYEYAFMFCTLFLYQRYKIQPSSASLEISATALQLINSGRPVLYLSLHNGTATITKSLIDKHNQFFVVVKDRKSRYRNAAFRASKIEPNYIYTSADNTIFLKIDKILRKQTDIGVMLAIDTIVRNSVVIYRSGVEYALRKNSQVLLCGNQVDEHGKQKILIDTPHSNHHCEAVIDQLLSMNKRDAFKIL